LILGDIFYIQASFSHNSTSLTAASARNGAVHQCCR